ncbi:type IV pilus secretin PilQ [Zobellella aerophila]|uniref:Type IV pilus secretin PilQ family protein n=1 Tax=Zobellella aerophila TaxID=870480 RepID=A0ABP6VT61_9GAMM
MIKNVGIRLATSLACVLLSVAQAQALSLEEIKVNPLLGQQLVLEMAFDAVPSGVKDQQQTDPDRILLQIPGAFSQLADNLIPIERQGVERVAVRRAGSHLEVDIALSEPMPYRLVTEGKRLRLVTGAAGSASQGERLPSGAINAVTGLDFKRGRDGQGQLLVNLDNGTAAVDMQVQGNLLLARFHNTHIPDELLQVMDVNDFATRISRVTSSRDKGGTLLTLETKGPFEYQYDQSGRLFVLDVAQPASASSHAAAQGRRRYGGKPISMNFQDIPVRTVLQLIADFNNFNLVTTDSVQGNLTLRLDGVPWEQVLDMILQVRGLDKRLEGNVLLIAPAAELAQQEQQQLENRQAQDVLAPLVTEFLQVNYAKATDIQLVLTSDTTRLLSERGAVSVDDRTNTLIIKDTADNIQQIRRMLQLLDIPIKQVVIEARMVTIDDGFEEAFGVRWGYSNDSSSGRNQQSISGTLEGLQAAASGLPDNSLNVNLPVTGGGNIAFQVAKLGDGRILDLELSALERENKAEIIASPRVTTSNQKQALIEQGTQIPYTTVSDSGTSVEFADALLSLKVTPQITPDNRVVLDLTVTQDSLGDVIPQSGGGSAVAINTQSINTQVLVSDGETLVLGGIFQQNILRSVTKVPVLGDIPVMGHLFKTTRDSNTKRELIIFVTPRIAHDSI